MAEIVSASSEYLTKTPVFGIGESRYGDYILKPNITYVDKTHFIKQWWDSEVKVTLLVRPRRFSKTMIMSTVDQWFRCKEPKERSKYFEGTYIFRHCRDGLLAAAQQFEPIFMTFKDINSKTLENMFDGLRSVFQEGLYRVSNYSKYEPEVASYVGYQMPSKYENPNSIQKLMRYFTETLTYLHIAHGYKFIILLDEYDRILMDATGVSPKYYSEITSVYRDFLNSLLKDRPFLERGILTGVLPLAANSVFSAFNNSIQDSFFDNTFHDIFGFTFEELYVLTNWMGKEEQRKLIERLKGYGSGRKTVLFNPWSVISYIRDYSKDNIISNYWVNTANTDWIKYKNKLNEEEFNTVSSLIELQEVPVRLNRDLDHMHDNYTLGNFLNYAFYTGYLTFVDRNEEYATFQIPNKEVQESWIANINNLIGAWEFEIDWGKELELLRQDSDSEKYLSAIMEELLKGMASYFDVSKENSYHMWVLGLLSTIAKSHKVKSNLEAGEGRFDIAVTPQPTSRRKQRNYIFELKKSKSKQELDSDAAKAVQQVKDNEYFRYFDEQYDMVIIGMSTYNREVRIKIEIIDRITLYEGRRMIKK